MFRRLAILFLPAFSVLAAADKDKSLARVAILTYEDETGTKNFGYMPNSLTEAIDKSLQQKFEYVREEPRKSEASRRRIKAHGLLNAKEAAEFCRKDDVQILVFGRFTYDAEQKQILVDTYISLGSVENFRHLRERRNPTNATIFTLADKVADDIVAEMTLIAREQKGNKGKVTKADEKIELQKEVPVVWSPKLFTANLAGGMVMPVGDLKTVYDNAGTLSLSVNRLAWRGLYSGIFMQFMKFNTKEGSGGNFSSSLTALPATLNLGYAWFFGADRWRANAEIGAGYYGAKLEIKANDAVIYTRQFANPVLRAAVSLHWLILNAWSVGFEVGYVRLIDQNATHGQAGHVILSTGLVF